MENNNLGGNVSTYVCAIAYDIEGCLGGLWGQYSGVGVQMLLDILYCPSADWLRLCKNSSLSWLIRDSDMEIRPNTDRHYPGRR